MSRSSTTEFAARSFLRIARMLALVLAYPALRGAPLFAQVPPAQPPTDSPAVETVDESARIESIRARHGVVALGGLALRGSSVVGLGASGRRRLDEDTPVTSADRWHLGSCTKAMTAVLCGIAADAGKLQLSATLPELFPELTDGMDEGWRQVTLLDLLRHRAGLPPNPPAALWAKMDSLVLSPREMRRLVAKELLSAPPARPVGKFLYSNTGYMLAGAALERAFDRDWESLMRERVFAPLGMVACGFGPPGEVERTSEPSGHAAGEPKRPVGLLVGSDNPPSLGPAGTVHASLTDWAAFVRLVLGTDGCEPPLVKPSTLERLLEPPAQGGDYAAGFAVTERTWARGPVLTHSGSNTMWYCVVWAAPDDDFAVLAVCNEAGAAAMAATDEVCAALIASHAPKPRTRKG
jgi:CubicO group peptidase (beta-lactamase class C family)